jgi:hypothetical protein
VWVVRPHHAALSPSFQNTRPWLTIQRKEASKLFVQRQIVLVQPVTAIDTVSDFSLTPQRRFWRVAAKKPRKKNGRGERI